MYVSFLIFSTGLVAIETTVNVLVEIMYYLSLEFPDLLSNCIPHFIKLLTATVRYVYIIIIIVVVVVVVIAVY